MEQTFLQTVTCVCSGLAALIVSPHCSSAAGTSAALWAVGQRKELAERTEWTWYLAGCLSYTITQGGCLWSSEGQSAGKTEQNLFPGNLGIGWVWVSGKCILLWLDLTHSVLPAPASSSQAHRGSMLIPQPCLPELSARPPLDPSFVGLGFWQSSDLDILKAIFMISIMFFYLFHIYTFVEFFFNVGKFIYQEPLAHCLGF